MTDRPLKVLIAKPGLDGHDVGAKIVARALMDAGFEVIYTGLRQTPELIVHAAIQEDVDVIGVSILSGAHMTLFPKIHNLLKEKGVRDNMILFGGGIIPVEDIMELEKMGIDKLFTPGATTEEAVAFVREAVAGHRKDEKIM